MPDPEPAQASAATPLPAPPEVVELPPQQAQIPEAEASCQHFQDPAPAKPPKLHLPVLVNTDGKGQGDTRISGCASLEGPEERALLQTPLRELQQPPVQGADGHYHQPPEAYCYPPFSSMDILNWQRRTPPYSGEPQAMIRLMESIFQTRHPTWDDIIQILVSLFSPEERHRILTAARKWLGEMTPAGSVNPQWWAELATPDERPNWDRGRKRPLGEILGGYFTRLR